MEVEYCLTCCLTIILDYVKPIEIQCLSICLRQFNSNLKYMCSCFIIH